MSAMAVFKQIKWVQVGQFSCIVYFSYLSTTLLVKAMKIKQLNSTKFNGIIFRKQ